MSCSKSDPPWLIDLRRNTERWASPFLTASRAISQALNNVKLKETSAIFAAPNTPYFLEFSITEKHLILICISLNNKRTDKTVQLILKKKANIKVV